MGPGKGTDTTAMREASIISKQESAIKWREKSQAVKFVRRKRAEGCGILQITDELGKLFEDYATSYPDMPNPYGTPKGCKPTKGTVSKWCREMNPLLI